MAGRHADVASLFLYSAGMILAALAAIVALAVLKPF